MLAPTPNFNCNSSPFLINRRAKNLNKKINVTSDTEIEEMRLILIINQPTKFDLITAYDVDTIQYNLVCPMGVTWSSPKLQ